jgi:hypothetical protein
MAVEFVKDQGFKLFNEGRSLLLKTLSFTKENAFLTDKQIMKMAEATGEYLYAVSGRTLLPYRRTTITPFSAQALPDDAATYKFTTEDALPYWLDGSIRLNPLAFYHSIENEHARDVREGFGTVHLNSETRQAAFETMSGFNAFAICTSADARKSERRVRHEKFGPRLLRINRANEFASKISHLIGSRRFVVRDVTYSDTKIVKGSSSLPDVVLRLNGSGDLKEETLEYLAQHHLDELIEATEAASAFTKPSSYWMERERRFLFAMDDDVTEWRSISDKALVEHIEVLV